MASRTEKRRIFENTFETKRYKPQISTLLVLPYVPIGCFIAMLRFCLLLNFLIARMMLRRFLGSGNIMLLKITQLFMMILGIKVHLHGKSLPVDIIVCNKRSSIDGFIICYLLDIFAKNEWNFPRKILSPLQLCAEHRRSAEELPIVVFPEKYCTSGNGIIQFDRSYFQDIKSMQPAVIKYWRLLPISISTVGSGILSDLFWFLFNPITVVTFSLSPECVYLEEHSVENRTAVATSAVAKMLDKPKLPISSEEVSQYLEQMQSSSDTNITPSILKMVKQVQEVMPHVPRNVIVADLKKTLSVDVTLANILEGVVEFVHVDHTKSRSNAGKSTHQTPFEKRKTDMLKMARQRYREKHGL